MTTPTDTRTETEKRLLTKEPPSIAFTREEIVAIRDFLNRLLAAFDAAADQALLDEPPATETAQ